MPPCFRVDLIQGNLVLQMTPFINMEIGAGPILENSNPRVLGICIGVLKGICGAIVKSTQTHVKNAECGKIQPFRIQYTIHLCIVTILIHVIVFMVIVVLLVVLLILEKWKV